MSALLHINVNDHTERKNNLTYLSWAWAWAEVLKIDPEAEWEAVEFPQPDGTVSPCMYAGNQTAMVKTRVTIKGKARSCLLPVMDHRNKAIPQPDAFAINTAVMRCMTKAISMHGLGLYIYAGEDLPEADQTAANEKTANLEEMALEIVTAGEAGQELKAANIFYAITDQEDALTVWGMLKAQPALRAAIKRNSPHQKAA